jgi:hypothetical protein
MLMETNSIRMVVHDVSVWELYVKAGSKLVRLVDVLKTEEAKISCVTIVRPSLSRKRPPTFVVACFSNRICHQA